MPGRPRRPMESRDIRRIAVVEELDLSADGRLAVVARRTIERDRYVTRLHAIPLDRGGVAAPRRLTDGLVRDGRPRIQPDGRLLAFVRSDPADLDAPTRIGIMRLAGGRIRLLRTRGIHGSVGEIAWSPDGTRLAFTAEVDPPRFLVGRVPPVGRTPPHRPPPVAPDPAPLARRIDRTDWRYDGAGHLDRWSHLFVVDAGSGARPRQVTAGDWGVEEIAWHPDGRTVAFTADRGPEPDLNPRTAIWAVDVDAARAVPDADQVAAPAPVAEPRKT